MSDSRRVWRPQPGPQTAFLEAGEFEVLYGGAAFGGKTQALAYGGLYHVDRPTYSALFLRRTMPELRSVIDQVRPDFAGLGAEWRESEKRFLFPSGASYEFGYCETFEDALRYQGRPFQYIGWDELGQIGEERLWTWLMPWVRSDDPGIIPVMRASANPGGAGHYWLKKRFVIPCGRHGERVFTDPETGLQRRFIPARAADNPIGLANNPYYLRQLRGLPELHRKWLLEGDWDAGSGAALEELDEHVHIVEGFRPPPSWAQFGAFDWGFAHPFSFGWYAVNEDGRVFKVDTVTGWRLRPDEIAERIKSVVPVDRLLWIVAGHDCWADIKARGENTPTIADQFAAQGIILSHANISRKAGLNNLRRYVAWRGTDEVRPGVWEDGEPKFVLMDTPGNQKCFDCLASMVTDPKDPEDVLKRDADPLTGEGGDDMYDETRYALASRPPAADTDYGKGTVDPWSPATLAHEYEKTHRVGRDAPPDEGDGLDYLEGM